MGGKFSFPLIFVADTKLLYGYNVVAPLILIITYNKILMALD